MSYIQSLKNDYNNLINTKQENGSIVIDPNKHVLLRKIEAIAIIIFNELDKLFVKKLHFCTNRQKLTFEVLEYNNRDKINDCSKALEYRKHLIDTGLIEDSEIRGLENAEQITTEDKDNYLKYFIGEIEKKLPTVIILAAVAKSHVRAIQTLLANSKQKHSLIECYPKEYNIPFNTSSATKDFRLKILKWNN